MVGPDRPRISSVSRAKGSGWVMTVPPKPAPATARIVRDQRISCAINSSNRLSAQPWVTSIGGVCPFRAKARPPPPTGILYPKGFAKDLQPPDCCHTQSAKENGEAEQG